MSDTRPHAAIAATPALAYAHFVSGKAFDLFSAYRTGRIPARGGYIVSSFMVDGSAYVRFEIVAYREAQALRLSDEGLSIAADAGKLYVVVEPAGYQDSGTEPWQRDARCTSWWSLPATKTAAPNRGNAMLGTAFRTPLPSCPP